MVSRRGFIGAGAALMGAAAWSRTSAMGLPEAPVMESAATQVPPVPSEGPHYNPVVTLNG